jgi:mono/diheme cytochrome c family protein
MSINLPKLLIALMWLPLAALADDDEQEQHARIVPLLSQYKQECAACHLAYPPGMLPAESWQRIMKTLPKHHSTDASLDALTVKQLSSWLTTHAAQGMAAPAEDRITRSS